MIRPPAWLDPKGVALASWLLAISPLSVGAQAQPLSALDIEQLLESGVSDLRIAQLARRHCLLFKLDAVMTQRLKAAPGASAALLEGLRTACYAGAALEVTSDAAGLEVWLGSRHVGTTPWSSEIGRGQLMVTVRRGEWRQSVPTHIPAGRLVRVHFGGPADTLAWPVEPPRAQLAGALNRTLNAGPSRSEPVAPEAFSGKHPIGRQIIGGVVGALVGGVAGYAVDPHSDSLAADIAAGGAAMALVGWWVGSKLDDAAYNRRVRKHERQLAAYDTAFAAWRQSIDSERTERLNQLVDSAVQVERHRADSLRAATRAENERIVERNRASPPPQVTVERLP